MSPASYRVWCFAVAPAFVCAQLGAQQPAASVPEPAKPATAPDVVTPPPLKGLQWQIGDTRVKLGGYIKVDLIHDFDAIDSTDSFDPRTIPTDGTEGENTRMHARQTRLNLDVSGPTSGDPYRAFIEGDFFSTNNAFRLRHAYVSMGSVLAGQTWSSFMDEDAMPETLDFESPIGFPQIRQAQLRYTTRLEGGDSYSFSVEDPASAIVEPSTVPGHSEEIVPDLTANYIWKNARGHVQVSAFGGGASYRPDTGSTDSVPLWGVNLSTKIATFGEDNTILQLTYGDGVGRYRGGVTAAPDANGDLEAITTTAFLASYQHFWSEKYRSTIMYSWADGDLPAGTPVTTSETLQYVAANFIWQINDRAWTGIEYLYGTNDTFDGNDGSASRLQLSLRFNL